MRFITPLLCICICIALLTNLSAEGTREVAPNGSINISGNSTTDIAALHINHDSYNNFASYSNNDPHSRLYINIQDPSKECIYLGFSFGHFNETSPNPARKPYEYRIKDPAGNVVFGPVAIPTSGGNIQNWSQAFTGPSQIHGAGGYDAHLVTGTDLTSQGWSGEGDYYIEFSSEDQADILVDFWDITVADCSFATPEERKGRIWSYNWSFFAVNDFGFPNRPFNGAFYVCAPDPADSERAFITKIDFNGSGFRPAAFNIAFNSFGANNTGNIAEDRKSVNNNNSTQSEYAIFLNDPVELCETAIVGEIALHGISRCDASNYCIKFTASKEGQVDLLLDFDGPDDIFTVNTRDVLITVDVAPEEVGFPTCVEWNGLDGLGNPVSELPGTTIPILLSYAQGIYHFPIYDAEFMTNGFGLQAVRPTASVPLLYYDDSNITILSGSGEPIVQLTGCTVPCHRWTNFPSANTPGFGNLNTINSWWFSQRIVRKEVLLLPAYYTCEVEGPQSICHGGSTAVTVNPIVHPASIAGPEIVSTTWTGPGIVGSNSGSTVTVDAEGNYHVDMVWVTILGDTCFTSCDYQLSIDPPIEATIDTLIVQGEVLVINGEQYTEAGQYVQELTSAIGCDSILTINVLVIQSVIYYDLDACLSFIENGSHMDYSEFTAVQPQPLSCADISATIVFREPANMQKHSCTPGVNNSVAMCISSLDSCSYLPGDDVSLVFEITVTPDPDTAVHVTGLSFFEKAPLNYDWINGESGVNNYPTLYGLRILKNGIEIYRRENVATTNDWTEQVYDFLNEDQFIVEEPATFRFELLPYCLIGNGASVAAWDIDEFRITASCAPFEGLNQIVSGVVKTPLNKPVSNVKIDLVENFNGTRNMTTTTNPEGQFRFEEVLEGSQCQLSAEKNTSFLNGVSTLDLIYIQKHLLGIRPFDNPYQFIAADANRSNNVSAKDLLELRKLILGLYQELPQNTSWRFGYIDGTTGSYPWGFKETIDIELLKYDFAGADFTGVKIGDINGTVNPNFITEEVESRTSNIMHLQYSDQAVSKGVPVQIDFTASEDSRLHGIQFALSLDDFVIQNIKSGSLQLNADHFNIDGEAARVSWDNHTSVEVRKGGMLFSVTIIPGKDGMLSEFLKFNHESIMAEGYVGENPETYSLELKSSSQQEVTGNQLFQNAPNPFTENTIVHFQLEKPGKVTIRLIDISGRVIKELNQEFTSGMQSVEISEKETGGLKGVVFCQLECDGYTETIRMVKM